MIARRGSIDLGNCTLSPRRSSLSFSFSSPLSLSPAPLFFVYTIPFCPSWSPLFRPCFVVLSRILSSSLSPPLLSLSLSLFRTRLSPEASHPCCTGGCHGGWVQGHACTPPVSITILSVLPSFLRRGRGRPRLDRSRRTRGRPFSRASIYPDSQRPVPRPRRIEDAFVISCVTPNI